MEFPTLKSLKFTLVYTLVFSMVLTQCPLPAQAATWAGTRSSRIIQYAPQEDTNNPVTIYSIWRIRYLGHMQLFRLYRLRAQIENLVIEVEPVQTEFSDKMRELRAFNRLEGYHPPFLVSLLLLPALNINEVLNSLNDAIAGMRNAFRGKNIDGIKEYLMFDLEPANEIAAEFTWRKGFYADGIVLVDKALARAREYVEVYHAAAQIAAAEFLSHNPSVPVNLSGYRTASNGNLEFDFFRIDNHNIVRIQVNPNTHETNLAAILNKDGVDLVKKAVEAVQNMSQASGAPKLTDYGQDENGDTWLEFDHGAEKITITVSTETGEVVSVQRQNYFTMGIMRIFHNYRVVASLRQLEQSAIAARDRALETIDTLTQYFGVGIGFSIRFTSVFIPSTYSAIIQIYGDITGLWNALRNQDVELIKNILMHEIQAVEIATNALNIAINGFEEVIAYNEEQIAIVEAFLATRAHAEELALAKIIEVFNPASTPVLAESGTGADIPVPVIAEEDALWFRFIVDGFSYYVLVDPSANENEGVANLLPANLETAVMEARLDAANTLDLPLDAVRYKESDISFIHRNGHQVVVDINGFEITHYIYSYANESVSYAYFDTTNVSDQAEAELYQNAFAQYAIDHGENNAAVLRSGIKRIFDLDRAQAQILQLAEDIESAYARALETQDTLSEIFDGFEGPTIAYTIAGVFLPFFQYVSTLIEIDRHKRPMWDALRRRAIVEIGHRVNAEIFGLESRTQAGNAILASYQWSIDHNEEQIAKIEAFINAKDVAVAKIIEVLNPETTPVLVKSGQGSGMPWPSFGDGDQWVFQIAVDGFSYYLSIDPVNPTVANFFPALLEDAVLAARTDAASRYQISLDKVRFKESDLRWGVIMVGDTIKDVVVTTPSLEVTYKYDIEDGSLTFVSAKLTNIILLEDVDLDGFLDGNDEGQYNIDPNLINGDPNPMDFDLPEDDPRIVPVMNVDDGAYQQTN